MPNTTIPPDDPRRINWAAYEWPGSTNRRDTARACILDAIQEYTPEVLEDLATMPFTLYQELAEQYGDLFAGRWLMQRIPAELQVNVLPIFRMPIDAWAQHWHLNVVWLKELAVHTVVLWYKGSLAIPGYHPRNSPYRRFAPIEPDKAGQPDIAKFLVFQPDLPTYHPGWMARWRAEEKITDAFKEALATYLDQMERVVEHHGWKKTPQRRNTARFKWFVQHVVLGRSYEELAQEYREVLDRKCAAQSRKRKKAPGTFTGDAVYNAVRDIAALTEFPLADK